MRNSVNKHCLEAFITAMAIWFRIFEKVCSYQFISRSSDRIQFSKRQIEVLNYAIVKYVTFSKSNIL